MADTQNPPPAQSSQPANPTPPPATGGEDKTVAIIAYLTLIGFIVAIVVHMNKKTKLGAFHLRQMLGFVLTGIAVVFCEFILVFIPILGWLCIVALWPSHAGALDSGAGRRHQRPDEAHAGGRAALPEMVRHHLRLTEHWDCAVAFRFTATFRSCSDFFAIAGGRRNNKVRRARAPRRRARGSRDASRRA